MSFARDILRSWRAPRAVFRDRLAGGVWEGRSLAYLITACLLIWVAQWPRLARGDQEELIRLVTYEGFAWLMVWPLAFYGLAALARLVSRIAGGQGTMPRARVATFWALLAASPAVLLYGLTRGFLGDVLQSNLVGLIWIGAFLVFWVIGMQEAERDAV